MSQFSFDCGEFARQSVPEKEPQNEGEFLVWCNQMRDQFRELKAAHADAPAHEPGLESQLVEMFTEMSGGTPRWAGTIGWGTHDTMAEEVQDLIHTHQATLDELEWEEEHHAELKARHTKLSHDYIRIAQLAKRLCPSLKRKNPNVGVKD